MRNRSKKKYFTSVRIILSAFILVAMLVSCRNYKEKLDHDNLIPEKTFTSILTDVYIADGLLSLPEFRSMFSRRDSISNYIDIIESYGYSYETMNKTVNYYFVSKPKKLIKIYDQITRNLSEMQSDFQEAIDREMRAKAVKSQGADVYYLPDTTLKKQPGFEHLVGAPGFYTLTFTITIYPDDLSNNPCCTSWYFNADSVETGKRYYLPPIKYIKDGHRHTYSLTNRIQEAGQFILKGLFYDYENNPDKWEKHARIENIGFSFTGMMPV
jgi:hypothetical protein